MAAEVATIGVELVGGERYDARGAWQGPLTPAEDVLELRTVREGDEYRIVDPPDAQIVPRDWFADRYRQANVYFFDRSARILVPEPIFVPRGVQAATTLVRQLLAGPADDRVESTAFPDGMALDFSTPVSDDGVADIRLVGTTPPPDSPDAIEKMLAQLAWTLRQEEITALRLTISDEEIRLPGGVSEYDVDSAPQYTPTGYQASYALHGLRDGLLVAGTREELVPVAGPFGVEDSHLRSVAVSIDGERAAGVSQDGQPGARRRRQGAGDRGPVAHGRHRARGRHRPAQPGLGLRRPAVGRRPDRRRSGGELPRAGPHPRPGRAGRQRQAGDVVPGLPRRHPLRRRGAHPPARACPASPSTSCGWAGSSCRTPTAR